MNLQTLFSPMLEFDFQPKLGGLKMHDVVDMYKTDFPDLEKAKIAVFSVSKDNNPFAHEIRKEFYTLFCGYSKDKIADLGMLQPGVNYHDTLTRIKEVCSTLIDSGIVPLVIGEEHGLTLGQYYAYENHDIDINVLNVDALIDIQDSENNNESHLKKMILHEPNYLFNFTQLAYQSYLNPPEVQEVLEQMDFDHVRLGRVVENVKETEPYFRNAHLVSIDLSAVKSSDSKAVQNVYPFGLTSEQICQMAWYSGVSNNCSSFGIYGYMPEFDNGNQTAKLVAVMLWYFIEGHSDRVKMLNFDTDDFRKYIVQSTDIGELIFYKNRIKNNWWFELETKLGKKVLPCNYSDYQMATEGEVSLLCQRYLVKYL